MITVHVIDPLTNNKKDFHWDKYVLQQEMKWFSKYIKSFETSRPLNSANKKSRPEVKWIDDLEITVHWQIVYFKWLYDFIHNPTGKHDLNNRNIHSILMSSDYLGKLWLKIFIKIDMPRLSDIWIDYLVDHLNDILSSKESVPAYKSHIAKNIARRVSIKTLDWLNDDKDIMLSRLYKKKVSF